MTDRFNKPNTTNNIISMLCSRDFSMQCGNLGKQDSDFSEDLISIILKRRAVPFHQTTRTHLGLSGIFVEGRHQTLRIASHSNGELLAEPSAQDPPKN